MTTKTVSTFLALTVAAWLVAMTGFGDAVPNALPPAESPAGSPAAADAAAATPGGDITPDAAAAPRPETVAPARTAIDAAPSPTTPAAAAGDGREDDLLSRAAAVTGIDRARLAAWDAEFDLTAQLTALAAEDVDGSDGAWFASAARALVAGLRELDAAGG